MFELPRPPDHHLCVFYSKDELNCKVEKTNTFSFVLTSDMRFLDTVFGLQGTEATRSLKLDMSRGNSRIVMQGLGKMKKLRYLEVDFVDYDSECDCESDGGCLGSDLKFDDTSQLDIPNSLKYIRFGNYPLSYLPKTFQANNLVGLEMYKSKRMVQPWEEGEKKVLKKLKFLCLLKSKLTTFDFRITPNLESFDLGLTPNLETLILDKCARFVKLQVSVTCPNLKFLRVRKSRLRSLDLELIPNIEILDLLKCDELVEINAFVGCLKKVDYLDLTGCLRFTKFQFGDSDELKVNCSSTTLDLDGRSLDLCPFHPNSNLPRLRFYCHYEEDLPSSVGNIEKLISFGLCACTDLKRFSDMICSLRCVRKLTLNCDISEFPKDLGQLKCIEVLHLYSTKIKHLSDSICMLKRLKFLEINNGDLLEKLPDDLGRLECLKKLCVSSKKIEYLPASICMLKRLKFHEVNNGDLLEKLPDDLGRLECLEKLCVSSKKIEYLPDSICMLKHLKSLNVLNCFRLGKLPEDIGHLESLEKLAVWGTMIKHLPDSIYMLKRLKSLDVLNCFCLEKLPEDIGHLESLERLALQGTMIKHLPDSIYEDGEAMKVCYKKFIDMVQVYYETAKMPWYEKKPKEDVVQSSSGNARVKDPQGKEKDDARIEEALEEDMNKKTQFGVRLEGNMEEETEEGSTTDSLFEDLKEHHSKDNFDINELRGRC
nr:hypothetical protein [Tanacetum cinerariifolium]